jgi:hypothetical protein
MISNFFLLLSATLVFSRLDMTSLISPHHDMCVSNELRLLGVPAGLIRGVVCECRTRQVSYDELDVSSLLKERALYGKACQTNMM